MSNTNGGESPSGPGPQSSKVSEPIMAAPTLERKLIAILAADVVGFSSHMERDEVRTLELLTEHRATIDQLIESHAGRVTGTAGDSVIAEFASVVNAVDCAVKIQMAVMQSNAELAPSDQLSFRIGINVGDVMVKDADIFGDGVNVAARLESLAEPNGVCISRGVHDYVVKQSTYVFEDLGEQRVKNIEHPIRAFKILFKDGEPRQEVARKTVLAKLSKLTSAKETPEFELKFWESTLDSNSVDGFEAYLEKYPEGEFRELAEIRIKELSEQPESDRDPVDPVELAYWESILDGNILEGFHAYLEKYPEGEFRELAELKIKDLSAQPKDNPPAPDPVELAFWETVKEGDALELYETYLEKYPEGEFKDLANIKIKELREQPQVDPPPADPVELAFWESVKDGDEVELYEAYLEKYPEGEFRELAAIQIERLKS